jgi:hypothetical protein
MTTSAAEQVAALLVIPFVLWQSTTGTLCARSQAWADAARLELRFVAPADEPASPVNIRAASICTMTGIKRAASTGL